MKHIKNLYLYFINFNGLVSLYLYLTGLFLDENLIISFGSFLLVGTLLAIYKPKYLTLLFSLSILGRILFLILVPGNLSTPVLVFLSCSLSLEILVLISLSLEVSEACYFQIDKRIISKPHRNQKALLQFKGEELVEIFLVGLSENYMTFYSEKMDSSISEYMDVSGSLVLFGTNYSLIGRLHWRKENYFCLELSDDFTLKDNNWPLIYDKIQALGVL